ncbi:YesL family protein [Acetivibrio ethanolgignens]|uniref:DUF624 domain-containing protein n=1 Tax=Acetivibrio ethanolgignens TaxID=290052 RepID=A0A0V8QB12_9FIRM|nr:YesL family protein [Acetivibrio ethanolgignens]KSV57446.1 hypothetical protein ASU35_04510 [Acetivibrio ethanolgignens]
MGNFFDPNSGIMGFMSKVADMVLLSLLWVVCSIPVVTIGAATAALYYTAVKSIRRDRSYIFQSFISSFKENLIQGTLLWLLLLAVIAVLGVNLRFCQGLFAMETGQVTGLLLMAVYSFMGLLSGFTALYMLPVLSRFTLKKREILKMSLFMSIRHLPYTILLAVIIVLVTVATAYVPITVLIAPAVGALLYSFPMERVLKQYIKEEEKDGAKDEWYLE